VDVPDRTLPSAIEGIQEAKRCRSPSRRGASCAIEMHGLVQDFFFAENLTLRRHDYSVRIACGVAATPLTSQYTESGDIHFPVWRRAYTRGPDRRPILDMLSMSSM
jgi:hypothetical protein